MKKKIVAVTTSIGSSLFLFAQQARAIDILAGKPINPGKGFAQDFGSLVNSLLSIVMVIAALLVFGFLIMGGIEYITSGGEKSKTESARNKITAAVIGLIILAASYALFVLIIRFLGFSSVNDVFNITPINQ
jgi:hypothetical protein